MRSVNRPSLPIVALALVSCNAVFGLDAVSYRGGEGAGVGSGGGMGDGGADCTDAVGLCALGVSCDSNSDCASGYCPPQDGVCCDTACALTCEACLAAKTGGEDGSCDFVLAGLDLDGECASEAPSTCGASGDGCDGELTSCTLYDTETACAPAYCESNTEYDESLCDGNGTCVLGRIEACSPYSCDDDECLESCASTSDCLSNYWCAMPGICTAKGTTGARCGADEQCLSGSCLMNGCA